MSADSGTACIPSPDVNISGHDIFDALGPWRWQFDGRPPAARAGTASDGKRDTERLAPQAARAPSGRSNVRPCEKMRVRHRAAELTTITSLSPHPTQRPPLDVLGRRHELDLDRRQRRRRPPRACPVLAQRRRPARLPVEERGRLSTPTTPPQAPHSAPRARRGAHRWQLHARPGHAQQRPLVRPRCGCQGVPGALCRELRMQRLRL